MNTNKIFTNDNCAGCNLCISKCPCDEANVAQLEDGLNKIHVDQPKCIVCGECLRICPHNARDYADDTDRFFADLEAGKKIPVLAAPALRCNVPQWPKLLGYLKSAGVNLIYDTSYGADICTWAYLRYISANKDAGLISQPCPAIVNYIECYVPELLNRLAPIHSPAMCTAVYMNKYKNIPGPYAFLSPCIAKGSEFNDPNTEGLIGYNVTFRKLLEYLADKGADFDKSAPVEYDNEAHGLGSIYSSPGGLRANVEQYVQGQWIFQVEGQPHASHFLHQYAGERGNLPFLVDILNCQRGCNAGTGACRREDEDYALSKTMFKVLKETVESKKTPALPPGPDFAQFDKELKLSDFHRYYAPKKITKIFVDRQELEEAFLALHKPSHEFRIKECRACGYPSCEKMASAVAKGLNHVGNCVDYNKSVIKQLKTVTETGGNKGGVL